MTIFIHELKRGRMGLVVWTGAIAFMILLCLFMFPEMKGEMESVSDVFSSMGSFTTAFGMDKVSFGEIMGFYGIECGNILGLGGAFFAALLGISSLAGEEKNRTAEFLLTHPIRRRKVVLEKILAVAAQIFLLNLIIVIVSLLSFAAIGEEPAMKEFLMLHGAYLLLQLHLAGICFGISAFIRRGSLGIGLGLASVMYFLNIISNITEKAEFLRYITPFGYADSADIIATAEIDAVPVLLCTVYAVVFAAVGTLHYCRKDIAA